MTAAVGEVILNLTLLFGWHVLGAVGQRGITLLGALRVLLRPDVGGRFSALWKYMQDMLRVIGACALIGLVHVYLE